MDEGARRSGGAFDTYENALERAKQIARSSVEECAESGNSAAEIVARYKMFADDPWIDPTPD